MTTRAAPSVGAVVRRVHSIAIEQRAESDTGPLAVSLSSETPVARAYGVEILDHGPKAVNLERAESGLVLLFSHNPTQPIGRVEKIRLAGRKLRGVIRFGSSTLAQEIERDVRDGILDALSVGYRIDRVEIEPDGDTGEPTYRVTEWTPIEASIVSIAADMSVGVGRSSTHRPEEYPMTAPTHEPRVETRQHDQKPNPVELERSRILEIECISERWNVREMGSKAIREGWPLSDFQGWLMKNALPKAQPLATPTSAIGIGGRELDRYSLTRALRAFASRDFRDAGLEIEASDAIAKRTGRQPRGLFVPIEVLAAPSQRAVTKGGSGGNLIATDLLSDG